MGRRALLIGIPEYDEKQLRPLPAVRKDVSELERVLQRSGYEVQTLGTGDKNETTRGRLMGAITDLFENAETGDTLLLYFSCHGCRLEDGCDYIIPADARIVGQRLADFLLPLEFAPYVDSSRAEAVLVVADACREGFEIHPGKVTKGPTVQGFGSAKRNQVSRGGLAYYLGCSAAEYCYCFGEEFSLFSRALAKVMDPEHPARTLREIKKATEKLCKELAEQYKMPPQSTWLQSASPVSADIEEVVFCEGTAGQAQGIAGVDPWASRVQKSQLWQGLEAGEGTEKARMFAGRIASSCRKLWLSGRKDLARDPWPDERLPWRVVGRLELLMGSLPDFKPSATEVCVLLTAPFLYQAVIGATLTQAAREAAVFELEPQSEKAPLRISLEKTHQGFPALVRQAKRLREIGRDPAADAVAAWMFYLCLRRRPETFLPADRGGALPAAFAEELRQDAANTGRLLGDAFGDNDLFDLIHCLAAEVEYPGRRLAGERRIGVDAERQPLRREALGTLLMMASELALDPTSLDGVMLSHLGTGDPLEPAEILETLDRAQWNSRGSARLSLDVTCRHPAVDQALRLQVDELSKRGAWLQRILENEERNALKPLRGLRWLFDVDDLKPERDENGQLRYTTPHLRFHLAQDEVRELLLGEQIYDDPSLAIREMYQNALDACRYRQAREEYLERKGWNGHLPPWEGKIVFRQWKEADGREILECEDNGVGMGRRELETCFARAGRRFADTPEYLEEEAEWHQLDPPIRLYPNSQFGIGVFSYFLLADEIEVFTRRFEKDGRPGKVLHVQLSGSGSLFRIRELEEGGQLCGCRIRLTLAKKDISCLRTLRTLLWRAEFATRVIGTPGEDRWESGEEYWEAGEEQWEAGEEQWEAGEEQWEAGEGQWEAGKEQWEAGEEQWEAGEEQWEAGEEQWEVGEVHWEPGILKPPVGFAAKLAATQHPDVFWLFLRSYEDSRAVILADGVLVTEYGFRNDDDDVFYGGDVVDYGSDVAFPWVLIDLKGVNRPRLTLDRSSLVDESCTRQWLQGVLMASGPVVSEHEEFNATWLWTLAHRRNPQVAVTIAAWLIDNRRDLRLTARSDIKVPLATTGFISSDRYLVEKKMEDYLWTIDFKKSWWRPHLTAWLRAGLPLPRVFKQWLDVAPERDWRVLHPAASIWVERNFNEDTALSLLDLLVGAEWTGLPVGTFASNLLEPWFQQARSLLERFGEDNVAGLLPLAQKDLEILAFRLNGRRPWLTGRVTLGHVWMATDRLGVPEAEIWDCLKFWAPLLDLELPSENKMERPEDVEKKLLYAAGCWLAPGIVTLSKLWDLAREKRLEMSQLWACLVKWQAPLGLVLPAPDLYEAYREGPLGIDEAVLRKGGDWLVPSGLTPGHIWNKARELGAKPAEIIDRIDRWAKPLGLFHLELPGNLSEPVGRDRTLLFERLGSGPNSQWLSRGPLNQVHVLRAAEQFDEPVSKILSRLEPYIKPFGLEIPEELYRMP